MWGGAQRPRHRLQLDLAVYRAYYHDLQVTSFNPIAVDYVTSNAASSLIQGVEFEGETYLDMIAAQMGGDEQEARQQAIALFSGLVGAMMLSRAVKKSDPTLSDELLSSARKILKLKN